jgi:geranylgeranyl diphosphate synthase type II
MEKLKEYFKSVAKKVNQYLEQVVPLDFGKVENVLLDSMRYSLFAGGKRFRPILAYTVYKMFDSAEKKIFPYCAALEMIHTYSLIHDDLPSMDDDTLRRGKPTNHIKYGEAIALLAGDGLLTHSFGILASESLAAGVLPENIVKTVSLLSKNAGIFGMVTGQVLDLELEGSSIDLATLEKIHRFKTGKLIEASVCGAALLAGIEENSDIYRALSRYSSLIGLIFQITDDILDVEGTTEELGKEVGSDEKKDKSTYPKIMGMTRAKELLNNYLLDAKKVLEVLPETPEREYLNLIPDYLVRRKN